MDLLHRHPLEVQLPPWAFAQLHAYRELQEQDVCRSCTQEALMTTLMRTCEVCGRRFEDERTKHALETL